MIIKLDTKKLLGFRIAALAKQAAKIGLKSGVKDARGNVPSI